jgi:hypothetical protein
MVKKMSAEDRFSEDKDKRLHRMKSSAEDGSKASSNSNDLEEANIGQRTRQKHTRSNTPQ